MGANIGHIRQAVKLSMRLWSYSLQSLHASMQRGLGPALYLCLSRRRQDAKKEKAFKKDLCGFASWREYLF